MVDKDRQETCWGPLSRHSAGKAGNLGESMKGDIHVFVKKVGERKEDQAEKLPGKVRASF